MTRKAVYMILKLRYWNLQIGKIVVPLLYILGVFTLYQEYGLVAAVCGWFLSGTLGRSVLDSIEYVSSNLNRQMN